MRPYSTAVEDMESVLLTTLYQNFQCCYDFYNEVPVYQILVNKEMSLFVSD